MSGLTRAGLVVLCVAAACSWWAPGAPAADTGAADLIAALGKIDGQIHGKASLSPFKRSAVHGATSDLMVTYYTGRAGGAATHGDVMRWLDCMTTRVQQARASNRVDALELVTHGRRCLRKLTSKLGTASKPLLADLAVIDARVMEVLAAVRRGKAFGAKATAIRRLASAFILRRFRTAVVGGVSVAEAYADLECVDVKVEAGRLSGASSCARRLSRLLKEKLAPPAPITWGSALTGDPVAIGGRYDEDTEFWTKGVSAPVAGTITQFRLKVGAGPVDLPLRFSVVRPQPDGQVKVITTTDPPYPLPAGKAGTYAFDTSALGFKCCKVQAGDIVTVDNRGTPTPDAYVWFAAVPGSTTFLHTRSPNQDAGMLWTGTAQGGYEVLLQVVEQPS